ncbi:MAG: transposase [Phyllobacteriaceae bacterium]|nr:transposase [Phyllobacteriaceae bacterium]
MGTGDEDDDARLEGRLGAMHEGRDYQRIEVISGRRTRRSWTAKEKAAIVAASAEPGANISDVARRFGVNRGLLTVWRRQAGLTSWEVEAASFVPITVSASEPVGAAVRVSGADDAPASGRIELEIGGARLVMTGRVDTGLAGAVVAALRGVR